MGPNPHKIFSFWIFLLFVLQMIKGVLKCIDAYNKYSRDNPLNFKKVFYEVNKLFNAIKDLKNSTVVNLIND